MNTKANFIITRIKSFGYAFKGLFYLIATETHFKIHCISAIVVTALGFYYNISTTEWLIQCLIIALILALEALNSAIEKSLDALHPQHHIKIGLAKDIAAAAVLIASIFAVIMALIIYIPKVI